MGRGKERKRARTIDSVSLLTAKRMVIIVSCVYLREVFSLNCRKEGAKTKRERGLIIIDSLLKILDTCTRMITMMRKRRKGKGGWKEGRSAEDRERLYSK